MKYIYYIICSLLLLSSCEQEITDAFALSGVLEVSSDKMQFQSATSTKTMEVKGVIDWDVDTTEMEEWCNLLLIKNHENREYITITVDSNAFIDSRSTTFNVTSGEQLQTVTVEQLGNRAQILFSVDSLIIGRDKNQLKVGLISNIEYEMSTTNDWFEAIEDEYNGEKRMLIKVTENTTGSKREGIINFTQKNGDGNWNWSFIQTADKGEYIPQNVEDLLPNMKVIPSSSNASSEATGKELLKTYDNDKLSYFQSKFQEKNDPIVLEYHFDGTTPINYINYVPYSGDPMKSIQMAELWIKEKGGEYKMEQTVYYMNNEEKVTILKEALQHPESIKFIVKTTYNKPGRPSQPQGNIVAFSEMEFYSAGIRHSNIFADNIYSELKPEVTLEDIFAMEDPFFRNIAYNLYQGSYPKGRIAEYKSFTPLKSYNFSGNYSGLDNVTGIVAQDGEEIPVFADGIGAANVYLTIFDPKTPDNLKRYKLYDGINKITADFSGHLYINYEYRTPKTVKIHIASGKYIGFYDCREGAGNNTVADNEFIDILGEHAHLIFKNEHVANKDVAAIAKKYDDIVRSQQLFMGLKKSNQDIANHILFLESDSQFQLDYADKKNYVICPSIDMSKLTDVEAIKGDLLWNIALAVGKIHNPKALTWKGVAAATPQLFALATQESLGENLTIDQKGWYQKAFASILVPEALLDRLSDNLSDYPEKIVPFWQLKLYAENVLGYEDFYADLLSNLRNVSYAQSFSFTKAVASLLHMDSGDYFKSWGFFPKNYYPTNDPKTPASLQYLTPNNIETFKKAGVPSTEGCYVIKGKVKVVNPQNVVAYMVRHTFIPTQIFDTAEFSVKEWKDSMKIYALGTDGNEIAVKIL